MERLGIQSGKSTEEMSSLRGEIYEIANAPDIRVDPSQLTAAVEAIVEKTGDLDFARNNLRLIAEAIQGSGGTGDALGRLAAEFRKLGVTSDEEVGRMMNLLVVQGKSGAFTLGNMASQGERLFSAFAGLGYKGPGAVRQLGAIVQMARQATGSSEQATTATEALLRTLSDAKKLDAIESNLEVRVRRPDDGSYRDLDKILAEIIQAVDGDIVQLSEIFDAEALRVFNALVRGAGQRDEHTAEGAAALSGLEQYRQYLEAQAKGNELTTDTARIAKTIEAKAQAIRTSFEAKLTEYFTGPLQGAATTIAEFQGEIVAAVGAAFLLSGAFKAVKGVMGTIAAARASRVEVDAGAVSDADFGGDPGEKRPAKGRGKGKSGLGPRVTRMDVGTLYAKRMVGGKGKGRGGGVVVGVGGDSDSDPTGKRRGRLGDAFRGRGRGAAGLGAAGGAVIGGIGIAQSLLSGDTENIDEDIAGLVGAIVGGALGGVLGSVVLPGVGTAVGGTGGQSPGMRSGVSSTVASWGFLTELSPRRRRAASIRWRRGERSCSCGRWISSLRRLVAGRRPR